MIEYSLVSLISALIIVFIFYLVASVLIREIAEALFQLPENTFHKTSKIAAVLTLFLILQLFVGSVPLANVLILMGIVVALYTMIKREYKIDIGTAIQMTLSCVVGFILVFMVIAYILFLAQ